MATKGASLTPERKIATLKVHAPRIHIYPFSRLVGAPAGKWEKLIAELEDRQRIIYLYYQPVYTFRATSAQKIEERRAAFFHTLVLDGGLADLRASFEKLRVRLEEKARELDLHRTHWSPAKTDEFMGEMSTEYNVMLSSTMRKFAMRVNVMDSQLAQKITKHGDRFEDKVTDWFRAYAKRNANDSCESLSEILADGENQVYRMIHNYEFRK